MGASQRSQAQISADIPPSLTCRISLPMSAERPLDGSDLVTRAVGSFRQAHAHEEVLRGADLKVSRNRPETLSRAVNQRQHNTICPYASYLSYLGPGYRLFVCRYCKRFKGCLGKMRPYIGLYKALQYFINRRV